MLLRNNIPAKYVFGKIKYEMIGVAVYSILVYVLFKIYHLSYLIIPVSVPAILITVVSLLLAFRSNQAYDRWWEARTIWGSIVNDSRTLGRQVTTYMRESIPGDELYFFKSAFIMRQIAWCVSLNHSLRGRNELSTIEKYLTRSDIQQLKNYNNIPMALLIIHGQALQEAYHKGWINSYQQVEMDQTMTRFSNSMGACERIKKTVFPVTYSMYIHLSLMFFIMLLPFSLLGIFGFITIPMVMGIAAVFFLIEKMAVHLQDPFENKPTDTPMTSICFTIERDLRQIINDPYQAADVVPEKEAYYVL